MNNAKHFIKRAEAPDAHKRYGDMYKPEADWRNTANQLLVQHDTLHRAATVVLETLKRGEQPTTAMIYDLENVL